jgi:hypothetical protein
MTPPDPIVMDCPGGGHYGNLPGELDALCVYCGLLHPIDGDGHVVAHTTVDVLAMLERGDPA